MLSEWSMNFCEAYCPAICVNTLEKEELSPFASLCDEKHVKIAAKYETKSFFCCEVFRMSKISIDMFKEVQLAINF